MKGCGVMAINGEVSPYDRCMVCGKKRAVFLCDFPANNILFDFPDLETGEKIPMQQENTCDLPMCEDCAVEVAKNRHFCKTCVMKFIIKSLPTLPEKIIMQHIKFKAVE